MPFSSSLRSNLNLTSPRGKKEEENYNSNSCSFNHFFNEISWHSWDRSISWPFWICLVWVACSELRLMHYGHVTQQLWFRCQVCHCQCHPLFWCFGCCIWICHAAIEKIYIGISKSFVTCHLSPVICPNVAVTEAIHEDVEESIDEQWWDEPVVSCL